MANYCSNSVRFVGAPHQLEAVKALFEEIENKQAETGKYYLPDFIEGRDGVMQDFSFYKDHINFETRWAPNLEVLTKIADKFELGFVNSYSEMMNGLYGEAVYNEGKLTYVELEKEDFKHIRYDRDQNGYVLGDDVFEFEGDLLDILLEKRKLLQSALPDTGFER